MTQFLDNVIEVQALRLQRGRDGGSVWCRQLFAAPGVSLHVEENPVYWPTLSYECGWLFRPLSLWIGARYSKYNRRWCINLLPMVTFWICLPGGRRP